MTTVVFRSTNESWFPGASRLAIHSPSLSVFPPLSYFLHTWPRLLYFPLPRISPDLLWFWRETVYAQAVAAFPLPGQSLTGSCSEVLWADTSSSVAYSRQSLESLLSIEAENMIKFWSVIFLMFLAIFQTDLNLSMNIYMKLYMNISIQKQWGKFLSSWTSAKKEWCDSVLLCYQVKKINRKQIITV